MDRSGRSSRSATVLQRVAVATLGPLAACGPAEAPPPRAPLPISRALEKEAASPASGSSAAVASGAPAGSSTPVKYEGHGASSVPKEVLARFAPTPLRSEVSRRIQAMLDIRAPGAGIVSPDGQSLYFTWNVTGTTQVWKLDGPRRFPVQLTGGEDVTTLAAVTPDGKWLVIQRDRKGEENPGLYLMAAAGGALVPVQHKEKVQTRLGVVTDDSRYLYYTSNDRKVDSYAVYRFDIAAGKAELVFGEDGLWNVPSVRGASLLLEKATGALTREYFEYDAEKKALTPLLGQGENEEYEAIFGEAAGTLLVRTARREDGSHGEFRRLFAWRDKKLKAISPEAKMDVVGVAMDRAKKRVYYALNDGGYMRGRALDARTFAEEKLPDIAGAEHLLPGATSADGRYVSIRVGSARAPWRSHVWDWNARKLVEWVVPSSPEIDTSRFARPELESYPARDGTKIPIFVRRPGGCPAPGAQRPVSDPEKTRPRPPCPVIVSFHGGPEGQAMPGFSATGQLFVDAGFVWVEPNVRGSDGYGRSWLHADDGRKRLDVIGDIEDASRHIRAAWAQDGKAPKVGVIGGSYGGYSTLVAMTRFAGAYDAGVAIVGMSNLVSFLENTAPYRRALRVSEYGDPAKDREALVELSPITHIAKVNAPLLLVQGASDPRVPVGEALQMHAGLEGRGQKTRMIIFPDEGHGAQKRENKVLELGHALDFFETHLK